MTVFTQPAAAWTRPATPPPAGSLAASVIATVKKAAATAPRSLQRAPGPSDLGTPCTRRLAYRALDWDPKPNSDSDPWASIIGTSTHTWMAETFARENRAARRARGEHTSIPVPADRYLVEHRVHLPGGITGSCDLFDRDSGDVIDWKITSLDNIRKYRKNGPGAQYRTQGHLYGLGLQLAGEHPERVSIVFLPRGGRIDGLHVWSEPYQPTVAVDALKRYQAVRDFHLTVNPEAHPDRWALLPTADAHCTYCPWFLPGSADLSQGCPGHNTSKETK